jgi:hypothetical protein
MGSNPVWRIRTKWKPRASVIGARGFVSFKVWRCCYDWHGSTPNGSANSSFLWPDRLAQKLPDPSVLNVGHLLTTSWEITSWKAERSYDEG